MPVFSATDAKNRFGELLDSVQSEPALIQKNGRDVAVLMSIEEYQRVLQRLDGPKVRPTVESLLARSVTRRRSLYKALAK